MDRTKKHKRHVTRTTNRQNVVSRRCRKMIPLHYDRSRSPSQSRETFAARANFFVYFYVSSLLFFSRSPTWSSVDQSVLALPPTDLSTDWRTTRYQLTHTSEPITHYQFFFVIGSTCSSILFHSGSVRSNLQNNGK